MLLWFLLFGLIVSISFFLAYQSMQDFQEKAVFTGGENSLYLVRHPLRLDQQLLDEIHERSLAEGYIFSIERLFKGNQSAMVIFGPKQILQQYTQPLHLLELEDYTAVDLSKVTAWEMGVKDLLSFHTNTFPNIFQKTPTIEPDQQFWWQVVMQPKKDNWLEKLISKKGSILESIKLWLGFPAEYKTYDLVINKTVLSDAQVKNILEQKSKQKVFQVQIRCVVFSEDDNKRRTLASKLEAIALDKLVKIPKPITSAQMLTFYKSRSLPTNNGTSLLITTEELSQLI